MLLAISGGGTYRAEPGLSVARWEQDTKKYDKTSQRMDVYIPSGATRADVRRLFENVQKAAWGDADSVVDYFLSRSHEMQESYLSRLSPDERNQFVERVRRRMPSYGASAPHDSGGH